VYNHSLTFRVRAMLS